MNKMCLSKHISYDVARVVQGMGIKLRGGSWKSEGGRDGWERDANIGKRDKG